MQDVFKQLYLVCYFAGKAVEYVKGNGENDRRFPLIIDGERVQIAKHATNISY